MGVVENLITFEMLAQMSPEERKAENERVWALRTKALVGRTIIGVLTRTVTRGKSMFWIKWNKSKCDTVRIPLRALKEIGYPPLGSMLKCFVTKLGPDLTKIKSAWCAHPMTSKVERSSQEACRRMLSERRREAARRRAQEEEDNRTNTDTYEKTRIVCHSKLAWTPGQRRSFVSIIPALRRTTMTSQHSLSSLLSFTDMSGWASKVSYPL